MIYDLHAHPPSVNDKTKVTLLDGIFGSVLTSHGPHLIIDIKKSAECQPCLDQTYVASPGRFPLDRNCRGS